uniref:Lipid storage droplets surface-binding protein 2 n=1 Tax=Clastoptera arizonana TaxID=38151 RepID=A0A1B6CDF8_9HEMI
MKIEEVQPVQMPHMEVIDRLWKLPVMESAWNTSTGVYGRVKNCHSLANWTFSTAEGAMFKAVETIAPIAKKFESPIHKVDEKLCQGLNIIERKIPCVKNPPHQVYENAKDYVSSTVIQPAIQTVEAAKKMNVKSLKDLSWSKANQILESRYGSMALSGLDTTTSYADLYVDYYLPSEGDESADEHLHPNAECEDKVLHTVHSVGRLSNKVGRRVYRKLSRRISQINRQNINDYLNNLSAVVQLTNYLNSINQGVQNRVNTETNTPPAN